MTAGSEVFENPTDLKRLTKLPNGSAEIQPQRNFMRSLL